jgi:hypothetical protein
MIVANYAYSALYAYVCDEESGAYGCDALNGNVRLNCEAKIIETFARAGFDRLKCSKTASSVQATNFFFHGYVKNLTSCNQIDLVGHDHWRKQ